MTLLQSLDGYYARMAARGEAEPPGFSREKIGFAIFLSAGGEPVGVRDLRHQDSKKRVPQMLAVPCLPAKRTVGVVANLFWDKTAYALGRTAGEGRRTLREHAQFKADNLALIGDSADAGLAAFARFLHAWQPAQFDGAPFTPDMLDANVVFALDSDLAYLHERPAAMRLLEARAGGAGPVALCLVTGTEAPIARLHPSVRGVEGAQSAGASLVSFNLDAFTSYGKSQGENAPTSEAAAFRYGQALNRMLDRGSKNRLKRPIGDASVMFWADTSETVDEAQAAAAETAFAWLASPPDDDSERAKLGTALELLLQGRPVAELALGIAAGTRFHVLGLAPNAARLAVRFWLTDSIDVFAARLAEHYRDLAIEPAPWRQPPSIRYLLMRTVALQEKPENVPPLLAGEVMRAVLTGAPYPRSWLAAAIARLRAGDDPATGWHAAAIHAVLARLSRYGQGVTPPMSLNRDSDDPAYNCGRLFATLENAQRSALGGNVNATIRDRYMGAASATPASIFPLLIKNAQNHLGKLRKDRRGSWIEREIEDIQDKIAFVNGTGYPRSLKLEQQGRFFLGYYHQRRAQFARAAQLGETIAHDEEQPEDGQ